MFVFKAAVVGAGTMGGQIAQTIAAAGIPVVLKDIRQDLVDAGLTEARNVTQGQIAKLVSKGKLTEDEAAAQVDAVLGLIDGTTSYDGFGDVDFVIEAGGSLGEAFDHLLVSRLFRAGKITGRFDVAIEALHGLETALTGIWKQVDSKDALPVACLERLEHEIRRKEQQG